MFGPEIENLIRLIAKLPGLGPRSGRRAALHLIKKKSEHLKPLHEALGEAIEKITVCPICGNVDTQNPCYICRDETRDKSLLCVVQDVADLWAVERVGHYAGHYHVLGGSLSALEGIGPEELRIEDLVERVRQGNITEVILALNATVDGQTTAHFLNDQLAQFNVSVTALSHGVPIGGELDYLDDGTITTALNARRTVS